MSVDEWLDVIQHPTDGSRVEDEASAPRFADGSPLDSRGGVKLFSESQRALSEFVRVAKPGAVVAWGDEGFGEGAPTGWRRRTLERINPGFHEPVPALPAGVTGASHFEVMNGCAWLIVARKAEATELK